MSFFLRLCHARRLIQIVQRSVHFTEPDILDELECVGQLLRPRGVVAGASKGRDDSLLLGNGFIAVAGHASGFIELPEQSQFGCHG